MRPSKGLLQAYAAQDFAHEALTAYRESLMVEDSPGVRKLRVDKESAQAIGVLIRALDTMQDRVRIHRGKPLPGSHRPSGAKNVRPCGGLLE